MGQGALSQPAAGPVALVGALIVRGDAILLGLRGPHKRCSPGCWDVIGGHVEPGETAGAALAREIREEIGVAMRRARPFTSLPCEDGGGRPARLQLFVVDRWDGEPSIANDEHVRLRWFSPADAARLPNLALDAYRAIFEAVCLCA